MLPEMFAGLAGRVNFVRQITDNEFHSSCPQCGGEPHEDGSYPDRFVMWIVSRHGTPFAICRKCGYKWSPSKQDAHWTRSERITFMRKMAELEAQYWAKKSKELEELVVKIEEQKLYEQYYLDGLESPSAKEYWSKLNIPNEWVEYLKLGFIFDYKVRGVNSTYNDNAFTIPIWSIHGKVENIKLRISHPINSGDRYRNAYKSGCQHLYVPLHESGKLGNKIVVMEGEKKAIVGHISGGLPDDVQVVGVQSVMPEKRILSMLKDAEVVYLAFDPDAYIANDKGVVPVMNVAKQIGEERCRLILPPGNTKFDDAILLGFRFRNAYNMAVKTSSLRV